MSAKAKAETLKASPGGIEGGIPRGESRNLAFASTPHPALSPVEAERVAAERLAVLVHEAVNAKVKEIARTTPRQVFDGDDALFLSWMSGFTAGYHAGNPNDKHAVEIFARCRAFADKLAPIAGPTMGGNAS